MKTRKVSHNVKKRGKTRKKKAKKSVFSKKDYDSNDGMLTSIWGPSLWHSLHVMSFNYPVIPTSKDKKNYKKLIMLLRHTLPCGICRKNLEMNLKECPLTQKDLQSRHYFSKWMYNFHEHVNKMLHKKSGLSYQDVKDRYENFRSRCTIDIKVKNKTRKCINKKEDGCTKPLYGKKAKCLIRIVPDEKKAKTLEIDKRCIKKL
tara:strand:- start:498 stop:1106 length:609 start_codon:yes stop_codon:yes gene_type:complete